MRPFERLRGRAFAAPAKPKRDPARFAFALFLLLALAFWGLVFTIVASVVRGGGR